jgi:hypothetical protein
MKVAPPAPAPGWEVAAAEDSVWEPTPEDLDEDEKEPVQTALDEKATAVTPPDEAAETAAVPSAGRWRGEEEPDDLCAESSDEEFVELRGEEHVWCSPAEDEAEASERPVKKSRLDN